MITRRSDTRPRELQPGVTHAVLANNPDLMLCEVSFANGATVAEHAHPHTQAIYIISGQVQLTIGDRLYELQAGDSCLVPPDILHGLHALTDARVLDIFTPAREDFLPFAPHASR